MKRFYKEVAVEQSENGWRVTLDGRPIRTQMGHAQSVPTKAAAEMLAGEWRAQGEEIAPRSFVYRDLADLAIDIVKPDRGTTIAKLLAFAGTDTLCYRADPEAPLFARQQALWEPLLTACEARHAVRLERVSGVIPHAQPEATQAAFRQALEREDDFTLAALLALASLAASLVIALATLEHGADATALFAAANAEEDWQAELWGWDWQAEDDRKLRLDAFTKAAEFARAVRS